MEKLRYHDNLAVSIAREHAQNSPVISKSEMFCFPKTNNVYSYSVTMLTQRNFHLLPKMNSIIRRVMEFGLIQKWEKDSDTLQQLKLEQEHIKKYDGQGEDEVVVLTVGHITGALILMGCGYFIALLTFIAELLINTVFLKRHNNWLWHCCDKFLDARRYFLQPSRWD